jgi:hypothetical protein
MFNVKKTGTFHDNMIHISLVCIVNLYGHWNKAMPFMHPFILADLSNGIKFHNCT